MANAARAGFNVGYKIHSEQVLAGLREVHRQVDQDAKKVMLDAAQAISAPAVNLIGAPSRARGSFIARATTRRVYITTRKRGTDRKVIGLLNFGGVVKTQILPVSRQALSFGSGNHHPVAVVFTPRHYKAKRFIQKAVIATLPRFSARAEKNLARVLQSRIAHARTFR